MASRPREWFLPDRLLISAPVRAQSGTYSTYPLFKRSKRRERLDENLGTLNVHLSAEDVTRISEAVPVGAAAGSYYPDMAEVYR